MRRAPPQTVSQRERQLENSRRQENVREETIRNLNREKMLEANMSRETRLEDKRFIRSQMQEQKERDMEDSIVKVLSYQCHRMTRDESRKSKVFRRETIFFF